MSTTSINVEGLEKIYRSGRSAEPDVHALKPLWLDIAPGEVFGLLGPNGAGKTTLVKLLLGIVFPTSGGASILGRPIGQVASKEIVGYLPENHRYPNYLTGSGVLGYFGKLSGLDSGTIRTRSSMLLEMVNMTKARSMKVKKYSKGMMQRLGIAQALINDPSVVFLDEPTDGVDPVGRKEIREIIRHLRDQGKTIFLNSHLLSEVEMISDRVAIMRSGEIVRMGTVRELTETANAYTIEVASDSADTITRSLGRIQPRSVEGSMITLEADPPLLNAAIDQLRSEGVMIVAINPVKRTLEELFMEIIGEGGKRS